MYVTLCKKEHLNLLEAFGLKFTDFHDKDAKSAASFNCLVSASVLGVFWSELTFIENFQNY